MEGNVLGDTCGFQPVLQGGASHLVLEIREYFCIGFVFSIIETNHNNLHVVVVLLCLRAMHLLDAYAAP